jgi:hypothetical protein
MPKASILQNNLLCALCVSSSSAINLLAAHHTGITRVVLVLAIHPHVSRLRISTSNAIALSSHQPPQPGRLADTRTSTFRALGIAPARHEAPRANGVSESDAADMSSESIADMFRRFASLRSSGHLILDSYINKRILSFVL